MYKSLLSLLAIYVLFASCKQEHSYTYVHTEKSSYVNFTVDGTTYHDTVTGGAYGLSGYANTTSIYWGDSSIPGRTFNLSVNNQKYQININAQKFGLSTITGTYKMGTIESNFNYYSYGSVSMSGFTNNETQYINFSGDTSSSFINVAQFDAHEIKGTFAFRTIRTTDYDTVTTTGDFYIITP